MRTGEENIRFPFCYSKNIAFYDLRNSLRLQVKTPQIVLKPVIQPTHVVILFL